MNIFIKLLGDTSVALTTNSTTNVVTVNQFLGKDGSKGYIQSEPLQIYGKSLRDVEVQQLEEALEFAQSGYPLVGALIKRTDKGQRAYVMANFEVSRGVAVPLKIVLEGNMLQFLKDLQQRKITINFTLEELVEATLND